MKLTVSYTGVGPVNLPVVLAKELGIFARNGLDVTVVRAQAAVYTGLDYWLVGHPNIKSAEQLKGAIFALRVFRAARTRRLN